MKHAGWLWLPLLLLLLGAGLAYLSGGRVQAENDPQAVGRMLQEIGRERSALQARQAGLDEQAGQLRVYADELERRGNELQARVAALKKQEDEFVARVAAKALDRQMIETFESVDPDSAAVLMLKLFTRDPQTASQLMRRLTGKKAGKILEAMVGLDAEAATSLAKSTIDAYKPQPQG
jgi:flagellar motility protein MotE (MotC chaperone)